MSRVSRRNGTKYHACPTCAVGQKGQRVWGYHGHSGARELIQHRMRAHDYTPRDDEQPLIRRFV